MNKIKKIICITLCLLMTFQLVAFADDTAVDYSEYQSELKVLSALGITDDIHFDSQAENFVTRYEFALLITRLLNADASTYSSDREISDVSDEQYPVVAYLMDMGIMNGTGDGEFSPNEHVTVLQAFITAERVLGYDVVAELQGSEDAFYRTVAAKLDLDLGVNYHRDDRIQYKYLTKILYNTLHTNVYVQKMFGDKNGFTQGNTLLHEKFDIKYTDGRINANDTSAIEGNATNTGYIKIKDTLYKTADTGAEALFGYYVRAYYKENSATDFELVMVNELEYCTTIGFDSSQLEYTDFCYNYYDENGKTVKYKLSDDFVLIVNGVFTIYDKASMMPKQGYITLVNTDDDSKYETVIIKNERLEIAQSYSSAEQLIAFKFNGGTFDLSKWDDEYIHIYDAKGEKSDASKIREWSVLSIMENKEHLTIYISNENVKGVVNSIGDNGGIKTVVIGEDTYEISPLFKGDIKEVTVNAQGTFYKDSNGRIAAYRANASIWTYALMLKAAPTSGIDKVYQFRALSTQSPDDCITLTAAKKIYINGVKCSNTGISDVNGENLVSANLSTPKLVRYKSNSLGYISELETTDSGNFVQVDRENTALKPDQYSSALRYIDGSFYHRYAFDGDTVMFVTGATSAGYIDYTNEDALEVADSSYLVSGQSYSIITYMENPDTDVAADVIIIKENEPINATNATHGMVKNITQALNADGEGVECIEVFKTDGKTETVYGETDNYFSALGIEKNDVVMYRTRDGVVSAIIHLYDYNADTPNPKNDSKVYQSSDSWHNSHGVTNAPVENIQGTMLQLAPVNGNKMALVNASTAKVIICDSNDGKKTTYSVGKLSDVKDIAHYGVSSKAVTYVSLNVGKYIYLYIQ